MRSRIEPDGFHDLEEPRTLTKSECASEVSLVVERSWIYGSAVLFALPSTKSPKLMEMYTFRTGILLE